MLVHQGSQASLDLKVYQDYQDLKDYQVPLQIFFLSLIYLRTFPWFSFHLSEFVSDNRNANNW